MGAVIAKESKVVDEDGLARRELARLLLAISPDLLFGRSTICALPTYGRGLMADLLLLPAGHEAASSSSIQAAERAVDEVFAADELFAADEARHDPYGSRVVDQQVSRLRPVALQAKCSLVPIPTGCARFAGPYSFRTPDELRHSMLPRAHLLARDMLKPRESRHFGNGPVFLGQLIDLCANPSALAKCGGIVWRPGMAAWAIAVAQASGGFPRPDSDADYMELTLSLMPTPFWLLCRAVRHATAMAKAMLDIPPESPFAFDVDNQRRQEVITDRSLASASTIVDLQIAVLQLEMDNSRNSHYSSQTGPTATGPTGCTGRTGQNSSVSNSNCGNPLLLLPDPALFRHLVQRCSDATLNALRYGRYSALNSLVHCCCRWAHDTVAPGARGPPSARGLECARIAVDLSLVLLERADPDGGGLDLTRTSPCGTRLPGITIELTAYDALLDCHTTSCYQCRLDHHLPFGSARCHLRRLQDGFQAVSDRRRAFSAGLLPVLLASLQPSQTSAQHGGMPVPDILKLVATFLLWSPPDRTVAS
jgi:hypothetical protein